MTPWWKGDDDDRRALATEVDQHLQRVGFLVVTGHRVERAVVKECRSQTRAFFRQPATTKGAIAFTGGAYRGWVGPGLESNAATYGVDTPPDLKETFAFGPPDRPSDDRAPQWFAPNRWPGLSPKLRPAAEAWWRSARVLADELLNLFELALDLPPNHLRDRSVNTTATGSLNWYWPRHHAAPVEGQYRIGPHTDFGTLTILARQAGLGGLQVQDDGGTWIDAPHVPGSLTVNLGDMLQRWTNDRWRSNVHRVAAPPPSVPDEELVSLIFFHEPDHDAVIDPFPSCVPPGSTPRYPPVVAGDYLAEKMAALEVTDPNPPATRPHRRRAGTRE